MDKHEVQGGGGNEGEDRSGESGIIVFAVGEEEGARAEVACSG